MPQTKIIDGIRYRRHVKICAAGTGTDRSITEHWLAEITPKELADNAWDKVIANVPKPSFGSAPPSSNAIVKYDMWLWTDPAQYVPVTAQASVQTFADG